MDSLGHYVILLVFCGFYCNQTSAFSKCVSTIPRQPLNSEEVFSVVDESKDSITQLFTCLIGFSNELGADELSKAVVQRTCLQGIWQPNYEVDCQPKIGCGGLWLRDASNRTCYLLTRAKGVEHSRRACWASQAELLSFKTQEEKSLLESQLFRWMELNQGAFGLTPPPSHFATNVRDGRAHIWIGLSSEQDFRTWRWVDDGDIAKVTNWAHDNEALPDHTKHYVYMKGADFKWYSSAAESYKKPMYKICKKSADDLITSKLKSATRLVFIDEGALFKFTIKGLRDLMDYYMRYEWGPIFLHDVYTRITQENFDSIISNIFGGNAGILRAVVYTDSLYKFRLQRLYGGNVVFDFGPVASSDKFDLQIIGPSPMRPEYSGIYKFEVPTIGLSETFLIFSVDIAGSRTSWTPWAPCHCNLRNAVYRPERVRFRICAHHYKPDVYIFDCEGPPIDYDYLACSLSVCRTQLAQWSEWTICNASCGDGLQSRHRISSSSLAVSNLIYDTKYCTKLCDFGVVRSVNIEKWMDSYPEIMDTIGKWKPSSQSDKVYSNWINLFLSFGLLATIFYFRIV